MTESPTMIAAGRLGRPATGRAFAVTALYGWVPLVGGLLCAIALLVVVAADTSTFTPGWGDPLNLLLTSRLYLGPLAAGCGAFCAAQLHRQGVLTLAATSHRGVFRSLLLLWVALAAWQVVELAAAAAALAAGGDLSGSFAPAMLLLPLSAVVWGVAFSGVGVAVGRVWPSAAAAPVVAGVTFVVLYVLALTQSSAGRFSPVYVSTFYQAWFQPRIALVLAHIALGAAVALASFAGILDGPSRLAASVGAVLMASTAAWGVLTTEPDPLQLRNPPERLVCADRSGVELCVWPQAAAVVEPGLDALVRARDAAAPIVDTPTVFVQPGLLGRTAVGPEGAKVVQVELPTMPSRGEDFVFLASRAMLAPLTCREPQAEEAWFDLLDLLQVRSGNLAPPPERLASIVSAPLADQRAWASQRLAVLSSCS